MNALYPLTFINVLCLVGFWLAYRLAKSERHLFPDIWDNPIWIVAVWCLVGPAITLFVIVNQ